jgi:hypothetical protein
MEGLETATWVMFGLILWGILIILNHNIGFVSTLLLSGVVWEMINILGKD